MNFQTVRSRRVFLRASSRIMLALLLLCGVFSVSSRNCPSDDLACIKTTVNGCFSPGFPTTVNGCCTAITVLTADTLLSPRSSANTLVNCDSLASSFANNRRASLRGVVILLDAGHGGTQDGALYDSVAEKNVNLAVTFKLKARLELMGAIVQMTRITDSTVSLQTRVDRSIEIKPDIFISVHSNANRHTSIDGVETYYYNRRSAILARTLLRSLASGLKERANWMKQEGLFVLHHNIVPSTLVEIGYLSNSRTNHLLNDFSYQERVAESIAHGVFNYFQSRTCERGIQTSSKGFRQKSKVVPSSRAHSRLR